MSVSTSSGHFVPKSGVGQGTGAFIYALSAGETSPALAAPCHAITALFSCRFKCPCPPRRQPHFRSNADRAYNTLHFASKVVCQRVTLWKPRTTKQAEYLALSRCLIFSLYLLSAAPVSWSAFCVLVHNVSAQNKQHSKYPAGMYVCWIFYRSIWPTAIRNCSSSFDGIFE